MLKGQVAMEYIVTYGWAILGIIILVGALSYFGIFRPEDSLPEKCFISKDIECLDYQIYVDGSENVRIIVKNLNRNDLYVSNVTCALGSVYSVDPVTSVGVTGDYSGTTYGFLPTNREVQITCGGSGPNQLAEGSKRRVLLEIELFEDIDFKKNIKGEVFSKVR